ncbi:MAG: DMT family transporter [Bacillota bacterium]|nr:DMT family transporter [Bacillota bacterium]
MGIIFSIIAGICMSLQGVFNTRLSEKIGDWETSAIVQGSGLLLTLLILLFFGNGHFSNIKHVNKLYLSGGLLGVIIVFTVMKGMSSLGPGYAVGIILISQLIVAALIDIFGIFGTSKINFHYTQVIGIILMIIGVIVFKYKK